MMLNRCIVCSRPVKRKEFLCCECKKLLEKDRIDSFAERCPVCNFPLVSKDYECRHCKDFPGFEVTSINDYSAPFSRRILQNYKFLNEKKLAGFIASELNTVLECKNKEEITIVPVPSSNESIRKRGWDQMKEVAKYLEKHYGYSTAFILETSKTASTEQKTLGKKDRILSVKSKYKVNENLCSMVDGKKEIVLIDDIHTTGATLYSCRKTLIEHGFEKVSAVTWLAEL